MLSAQYLAGLFDGEGYVTVIYYEKETFAYTRCQVRLGISMTYRPIIQAIAKQLDGYFTINASANKKNPKNRIAYVWDAGSRKAEAFLKLVYPYLVVKRSQAKLALKLCAHMAKHHDEMKYSRGKAKNRASILAYRRNIVAQIRHLKKETFSSKK